MHLSSRPNRLLSFVPSFLLAHPALAAAQAAEATGEIGTMWSIPQFLWDSCRELGWERVGTPLLITVAIAMLLLWPMARLMAGRKEILSKTAWFIGHVSVLSAAFLALGYFVALSESLIFLAVWAAASLAILLFQTGHIFQVSRAGAVAVFSCFILALGAALYATELLTGPTPWTEFLTKNSDERGRVFAAWKVKSAPQTATAPAPAAAAAEPAVSSTPPNAPAPEPANAAATAPAAPAPTAVALPPQHPGPDLQLLFTQLQKTRAELDMSDAAAVARFNEQVAAYQREKALAAAIAAQPANPAKADARRSE